MTDAEPAWIALGSNLQDPLAQVETALSELQGLPRTRLLSHSSLYRSVPLGPADQADYINAVAHLETSLDPLALLDQLQRLERAHGRERGERWGPRTLDLDLLLFADRIIESERLRVPHPQMHRRAFVLLPLAEISPDIAIPGKGGLDKLLSALDRSGVQRLAPDTDF